MKKAAATIWMLVYFAVSTGVMVNYHYCMNRLASTQFYAESSRVCPQCGMHTDSSHGCCRDEVKIVKMENDQPAAHWLDWRLPALDQIEIPYQDISFFFQVSETDPHQAGNLSPPLLSRQDTYLQNGVFRI